MIVEKVIKRAAVFNLQIVLIRQYCCLMYTGVSTKPETFELGLVFFVCVKSFIKHKLNITDSYYSEYSNSNHVPQALCLI